MTIQRMNYFKGEFLHAEDFQTEQTYHVEMRKRHNSNLHTPGIVNGLNVKAGTGTVTIENGLAIDKDGREILLNLDSPPSFSVSKDNIIGIKYKEVLDPASDNQDTSFPGKKRWIESYEIVVASASDPDAIFLAKVTAATDPVTLDTSARIYSAPVAEGDMTVKGDLTVNGDLKVQGTTTVVNKEVMRGDVILGDQDTDIVTVEGKMVTGNSTGKLQIGSPTNIAGDLGVTGTVTAAKFIGDGSGLTGLNVAAPTQWIDGASNSISYNKGNVGIGTPTINPNAKLHLKLSGSGNFDHLRIESPQNNVGFGITLAQPSREWWIGQNIGNFSDGRFQILDRTANAYRLMIDANGNVGIGATNPTDCLDINLGTGAVDRGLRIQGSSAQYGDIGLKIKNTGIGGIEWYLDSTNNASGYGGGKLAFVPGIGKPPAVVLTSDGNVGIGTTGPSSKLQVQYNDTHYVGTNVSVTQAYTSYRNDANEWKAGLNGFNGNWYMITANQTDYLQIHSSGILNIYCNQIYLRNTYNETIPAGRPLNIASDGRLGYIASSIRYKKNIRPLDEYSSKIYGLKPVAFDFKEDAEAINQFGLIAEEVDKVIPELVSYDAQQRPETVLYSNLIPLLLREVIRMKEQIDILSGKISKLENK